jgi:hypothetical protein
MASRGLHPVCLQNLGKAVRRHNYGSYSEALSDTLDTGDGSSESLSYDFFEFKFYSNTTIIAAGS